MERAYHYFEQIPKEKIDENISILYSYITFSRIYSFSKNIRDAIKSNQKSNNWDYNLLFITSRSIIESVEALFFLCIDEVSVHEKNLRAICLLINEITDLKRRYAEIKSNVKNLPEEDVCLVKNSLLDAEEKLVTLKTLAEANESFKNEGPNKKKSILSGQCKYYHTKKFKNSSEFRYYIEKKMNISPLSTYKLIYHRFSYGVHPYNIYLEPAGLIMYRPRTKAAISKRLACEPILVSTLYIRYASEQIIHKLLLTDMKKWISETYINELEMIMLGLRK